MSADGRTQNSEVPSAATTGRSVRASVGAGSRALRPLAFDGPAQISAEVAAGARQAAGQQLGGVDSRAQAVQGRKYGTLPVALAASAERAAGAALASPVQRPCLALSEPDSAERLPKRQRLPMTPLERGETPCGPAQGGASPYSAELPPRCKCKLGVSDRLALASPNSAVPAPSAAARSPSHGSGPAGQPLPRAAPIAGCIESPPHEAEHASARRASVEGLAACSMLGRQVVPETPARSSPTAGTVATSGGAQLPSQPHLDAQVQSDCHERRPSPREQPHSEHADAPRPAVRGPLLPACDLVSVAEPRTRRQAAAVAAQLGAMQLHGERRSLPAQTAVRHSPESRGSDADLPDADAGVPETDVDPLCPAWLPTDGLPLLTDHTAEVPAAVVEEAPGGLPLLTGPAAESPPSELGSVVPGTQSPPESPSGLPHSKRRKSTPEQWQRQSHSEPSDPDRCDYDPNAVPETLPWDAGCSEQAGSPIAIPAQRAEDQQKVGSCHRAVVEATGTRQLAEGERSIAASQGDDAIAAVHDGPAKGEEQLFGLTVQLGEAIRCALSSPDGRYCTSPHNAVNLFLRPVAPVRSPCSHLTAQHRVAGRCWIHDPCSHCGGHR